MDLTEYFAVTGSRWSQKDAQIIGPMLEANLGKPIRELWQIARSLPEGHPFRAYFVWDKDKAWEDCNIERAGEMQRGIGWRRVTMDRRVVETRAFNVVPASLLVRSDDRKDARGHPLRVIVSTAMAVQRPVLMASILAEIRAALVAIRRKYAVYQELIGIHRLESIDEAISLFDDPETPEEDGPEETTN